MFRRVSVLTCAAAVVLLAGSISCSRKTDNQPAVATPSLTLSRDRVPIGSPVKLTYKFVVAPDAKLTTDYWVFVHILDPTGELLWTDDHLPAPPTSTWKPGQTVEYTRTVFVPNYPYIGEAAVRLGLYDRTSTNRLTLNAQEVARKEYLVAKFQLQPQSENIFLISKDGWHPAEFYLELDARTDLFNPPQQVTLRIGSQTIATFAADTRDRKLVTYPITAAQLGAGDMTELVIDVDRTFSPGNGDTRELGVRVFHAFVEPK
jgi:hypothetical protein